MSIDIGTFDPPAPLPESFGRITVERYHAMIEAGTFTDDDPIELLEGYLVTKMAKNPPHSVCIDLTHAEFEDIRPAGWFLKIQDPITTEDSESEPDITAVRGKPRDFLKRHPGPLDVGLLVEVADTSLARDRGTKKRAYARARILVYWIVNLIDRQVEVYTDPTGPAAEPDYRHTQVYKPGESIPVVLDGTEVGRIEVNAILP